jgi:lipopolysaccharide/colanic/teichoic acid biosynthesis glycosyltransferase
MAMSKIVYGLSFGAILCKRAFDLFFSFWGIVFLWWIIVIAAFCAWLDTGENGFFTQDRVGQFGKIFRVIKIRTMKSSSELNTTVTTSNDKRITALGKFFRKTKIDELPQLINVFVGQMSFVGPRPDVPGFADGISEDCELIRSIKPGITGPATLTYRNEEELLASVDDPERYNRDVIFPDKIRINKEYIKNYTMIGDIKYIISTILGPGRRTD